MGKDELVKVNVSRVIGENTLPITMTKGELMGASPKRILETALANPNVTGKTKRELELIKKIVDSGVEPQAIVLDQTGDRKLIPYTEKGVEEYLNPNNEVVIEYGTQDVIG
ncbi:hypothetical protein A3K73_00790 [Candidatus Pacearchaeota archaeon RBG_13_36_9]|nr:MAG: hypothetical protein A3K73_00790 [Candidatus Pacearchaeota archaeon RBG_13_36_9]